MQYLNLKELDEDENYWLQALRTNLKAGEEIRTLVSNYEKNRHSKDYSGSDESDCASELEADGGGKKGCATH